MPSQAEALNTHFAPYVEQILRMVRDGAAPTEGAPAPTTGTVATSCYDCTNSTGDLARAYNGRTYCVGCIARYERTCAGTCGNRITNRSSIVQFRNAVPGTEFRSTNVYDDYDHKWYCAACAQTLILNEQAWSCRACNAYHLAALPSHVDTRGRRTCMQCRAQSMSRLEGVLNYTSNVLDYLQAFPPPSDALQFGVELEIQTKANLNSQVHLVRQHLPEFAICKADSSITRTGKQGFEIVTVPATVAEHKAEWSKLFASNHKMVSWASGECGMHVHVTRAALTPLQIGKIRVFIHNPLNAKLVMTVAGRYSSHYTRFFDKEIKDCLEGCLVTKDGDGEAGRYLRERLRDKVKTLEHDHRYEAINLVNRATIEFRIFRGNLKPESFFKNLEFVEAVVRFCKDAGLSELTEEKFSEWLIANRKPYPNLVAFLIHKKYLKDYKNTVVSGINRKPHTNHLPNKANTVPTDVFSNM